MAGLSVSRLRSRAVNCSGNIVTSSGFFYRRFAGHLQFRPQRVADELMHGFIGEWYAKLLAQLVPNRLVAAKTSGLGEALP
jgi:hypothetical protein